MIKFLPEEKIILNLVPVKLLMYKWFGGSYYWTKMIIVTNKRIIISFQWFGYENFTPALSCYYSIKNYNNYKKSGDSLIIKHNIGKGRFLGDFIKLVVETALRANYFIFLK